VGKLTSYIKNSCHLVNRKPVNLPKFLSSPKKEGNDERREEKNREVDKERNVKKMG
jgi:hypothetical protein